jgi:4-hydroxy-tetrahydrodipicolinate synthase
VIKTDIGGMIVATLTPYDHAGRVDVEAAARHVGFLAEAGMDAVAPGGTTGEFLFLSVEERSALVRAAVEGAAGRLRVIAGIWALDVEGVGRLAQEAEQAGANAVYLTTPIYYPASDDAIFNWYREAARHTSLPLFAYHIPRYAVNGISVDLLNRLIDTGIIGGIKDSTGDHSRLASLLHAAQQRIAVFGASDSFALDAREIGADGFISALANIFPRTFARIWQGDAAAQEAVDQVRSMVKGYGGIGALKTLLRHRGFDFGGVRLPFGDLDAKAADELAHLVESLPDLQ